MPADASCGTCRFWATGVYASRVNECRCHAPTLVTVERHAEWPLTRAEEWCGEWQGRAEREEVAAVSDERAELRASLEAAGVKVDGRWSVARMREELSRA